MTDLVDLLVQQTIDKTSRRWIRRTLWILWLAVGCTVAGIWLTDWRWFALAAVELIIAGIHALAVYWENQPDMHRRIAVEVRRQLAMNPEWRPK